MRIGLWTWNAPIQEMNWWASMVDRMKSVGVSVWIPKILDGEGYFNGARLEPATLYARQNGLDVYAWGYERDGRYADPALEGTKLGSRAQALHATAVVADVEAEWRPGDASVQPFLAGIRNSFGDRGPLYFSSYSTAQYHPEFPWTEFIGATDGVIPQVYQTPPDSWLDLAITDFSQKGAKSIRPVGLADRTVGSEGLLDAFLTAAEKRNLAEVSLWCSDHITDRMWAIIKEHTHA